MKATTTKKLAELKKLASRAGDGIYQRLKLCAEVLRDDDWILMTFGGVLDDAVKALEDDYFPDLKSFVSLDICLVVYRAYPDREIWRQHSDQLGAMIAMHEEQSTQETKQSSRQRTNWKQVAAEEELIRKKAEQQVENLRDQVEMQRSELAELRSSLRDLEHERDRLLGRIEELERLIPKVSS